MILQFGTSRFLQAHVDLFAHEAAEAGQTVAPIAIIQTTRSSQRAGRLKGFADPAGYPVLLRGIDAGQPVERMVQVRSVTMGLNLHADWERVCELACGASTHWVSNTGDTGFEIDPLDRTAEVLAGEPPRSFPAILLALLYRRWRAGAPGVTLLPCELVQQNGSTLRDIVAGLGREVGASGYFLAWLSDECVWANTLVDRIVSGSLDPAGAIAEPYALWAVERQAQLVMPFTHPDLLVVEDLEPYERLKLHILNLGHSWLAGRWHRSGAEPGVTVRAMLVDRDCARALARLYAEEVVPGFAQRGLGVAASRYVETTLERFANPFLDHLLSDIHQNHATKLAKRVGGFVSWVDAAAGNAPAMPELRAMLA